MTIVERMCAHMRQLEAALLAIEKEHQEPARSKLMLEATCEAIVHARIEVHIAQFSDEAEEIRYFKEIFPSLYALHIYHYRRLKVLFWGFTGSLDLHHRSLKKERKRIRAFFKQHEEFYTYYKSKMSHHDRLYYVRESQQGFVTSDHALVMDNRLSTPHSYRLAQFIAYERMLYELEHAQGIGGAIDADGVVEFTDADIFLDEVAVGFFITGSCNHGKATLAQISNALRRAFNKGGTDIYAKHRDMKARKYERTRFLQRMSELVREHFDEADERPSR